MEVLERPDRVLHEGLCHLDYDHWDYDHGNLDLLAFDLHHLLLSRHFAQTTKPADNDKLFSSRFIGHRDYDHWDSDH